MLPNKLANEQQGDSVLPRADVGPVRSTWLAALSDTFSLALDSDPKPWRRETTMPPQVSNVAQPSRDLDPRSFPTLFQFVDVDAEGETKTFEEDECDTSGT